VTSTGSAAYRRSRVAFEPLVLVGGVATEAGDRYAIGTSSEVTTSIVDFARARIIGEGPRA